MRLTLRLTLLWMVCLACVALPAETIIEPGGRAGGRAGGVIHVTDGWRNNGGFGAGQGAVRFYGEVDDYIESAGPDTLYNMIVDKPGATLYVNGALVVKNTLMLSNGVLSTVESRAGGVLSSAPPMRREPTGTQMMRRVTGKRTSRLLDTDSEEPSFPLTRLGSLLMGDGVEIVRHAGSLAAPPDYTGTTDITYKAPCATGPELVGVSPYLRMLTLDAGGEVALQTDTHVGGQLVLRNSSTLSLGSHSMEMGLSAPVIGYPEQIDGTLAGQPYPVGTGSYNNANLGVGMTSGVNIGNFSVVQFQRETDIGAGESIRRRWQIDADYLPQDRDLAFTWPYYSDNGVDLAKAQMYYKVMDMWFAIGDPQDLTGAGTTRLMTLPDFGGWGEWTVGESQFTLSDDELDFGDVTLGETQTRSFTVYNDQPAMLSGVIVVTGDFTVSMPAGAMGMIEARHVFEEGSQATENTRNNLSFNVPANDSATFNLTFEPSSATAYEQNVMVRVSSAGYPSRLLHVTGVGSTPAEMAVTPESLEDELHTDSAADHMLYVANSGDDDLTWSAQAYGYLTVFLEDFEASFPPQGWGMEVLQQTAGWTQSTFDSHSDDYSALADWNTTYDARLYTHAFTVPANARLDWWIRSQDSPIYGGEFLVEISTSSPAVWDTLLHVNQNTFTQNFEFYTLDLADYEGQTVQIAFRVADNYWKNGVFIDDVAVRSVSASAPAWLTIDGGSTTSGVTAGGAASSVALHLDSTGLADGAYTAAIQFQSDGPTTPEQMVQVTMLVATPGLAVSQSTLAFGELAVGQTSTQSFTIENTGNADLIVDVTSPEGYTVLSSRAVVALAHTGSARLVAAGDRAHRKETDDELGLTMHKETPATQRNTLGYTAPPGAIVTVEIEFAPTQAIAYAGDAIISHNAPGGDEAVALSGDGVTFATVTTAAVTNIEATSAEGGGEVTDDGNGAITNRGVCWSVSSPPTVDGDHTVDGSGPGAFNSFLYNLSPDQQYFVRAYAVNAAGVAYGDEEVFSTSASSLSPPQNVRIEAANGHFTLSWDEVDAANSYYVFVGFTPNGPFVDLTSAGAFGGSAGRVEWSAYGSQEKLYFYVVASTDVAMRE